MRRGACALPEVVVRLVGVTQVNSLVSTVDRQRNGLCFGSRIISTADRDNVAYGALNCHAAGTCNAELLDIGIGELKLSIAVAVKTSDRLRGGALVT